MADNIVIRDSALPGVFKDGPLLSASGKVSLSDLDTTGAINGDVITLILGVWTASAAPPSGDTASNLGAGNGVFASKVGNDFQFKSLIAGTGITLTPTATDITIATSGGGGGLSESFTSAPQVITLQGALTLAHGLTGAPTLIQLRIKNTTAELGYSIGDELIIAFGADNNLGYGCSVVPDATNLNIRYGSTGGVFYINNKSNGTGLDITAANWTFIARAWR